MTVYRNPTSPFWDFPRPKIGSFSATRSVRQAEITNHLIANLYIHFVNRFSNTYIRLERFESVVLEGCFEV